MAAMFIACGQDAGSVAESAWTQLTTTYDAETKILKQSLFVPSLPVGSVGGGTMYPSQKASLGLLKCQGEGGKRRLAGLVACFCMALDISTAAAIASGGFTDAHKKLARSRSKLLEVKLTISRDARSLFGLEQSVMSAALPKARKLSSFVKCGRCRQDRQKCERPDESQKCLRCAKHKHNCDSGRPSNRAQRVQKLSVRQRALSNEQAAVASSTTQSACLAVDSSDPGSSQDALVLKVEDSSSSRSSRSASFELATSWSPTSTLQDSQTSSRYGSIYSLQGVPDQFSLSNSPSSAGHSATYGQTEAEWLQGAFHETSNVLQAVESPSTNSQMNSSAASWSRLSVVDVQMLSGLTNVRPSRLRTSTPFEQRLDTRIDRLWGNYKTFANASSKGLGVTPLFGRTLSELFRQSRQMAENGDDLVADVRFACGAADACMNKKLSKETRARYLEAYHHYDSRANVKYRIAVEEFARQIAEDESPDVLPLYTATFLHYAAGACMKGSDELLKATFAFKYFNQFTAGFPIRIRMLPAYNGTWSMVMLLANNDQDPGMKINTVMFALGRARVEFDREEGLC
ncbi:hypothetical protein OPT61_g3745 [Boeremia exigua]|uniref:Uncharacterized protein n=1 Tax=Boeremia exigua TaxID=749465 RepID=A0ACC2IGN4_9PLEO|nr:hypothetical protein OPT61_g3745 [Boeremia exigua]